MVYSCHGVTIMHTIILLVYVPPCSVVLPAYYNNLVTCQGVIIMLLRLSFMRAPAECLEDMVEISRGCPFLLWALQKDSSSQAQ